MSLIGEVPEWPKGTGCKPVGLCLRRFKSSPLHHSGSSSVVERQPSKLRVAGSNPVSRSIQLGSDAWSVVRPISENQLAHYRGRGDVRGFAHVAQSAEHILGKDEVTGSIPVMGSTNAMNVSLRIYVWQ